MITTDQLKAVEERLSLIHILYTNFTTWANPLRFRLF